MKQLLVSLALLGSLSAAEINLDVTGIVDNREYFDEYANDGTTFGLRETGTATIGSEQNSLTAGITWLQEFGAPIENWPANPVLFYRYNGEKGGRFLFGSFPRIGNALYSTVLFDERFTNFHPVVQGFDFRYTFTNGMLSAWVDWDGRQTSTTHESFFFGLSGKETFGKFGVEQYWHYRHIASRAIEVHDAIRENGGAHLILSYENNEIPKLDTVKVTTELIGSYDHPSREESWNNPLGAQVTGRVIFHKIGIGGLYYKGILKDRSWHNLDQGAPFYTTSEFGNVNFCFYPVQTKNLSIRFNWTTTFVAGMTENEQHLNLNGHFGKILEKKKSL